MAAIHVSSGSTVKITSENGDGSTDGSLEARGGDTKYGGAAIGTRYNDDTGTIIIAGGTIRAYGGHCAAGIGSGRDGKATDIQITGGNIYAEGGQYAAGIGAGDNAGGGEGGDLNNITITGGTIEAHGGKDPDGDSEGGAGIGCSEGGQLHGTISIENAVVTAYGSAQAAGIGGGEGRDFDNSAKIFIKSGTIKAYGGRFCAGIGTSSGDGLRFPSSSLLKGIEIKDCKDVYAQGGQDAAGIGCGLASPYETGHTESGFTIVIENSKVTAKGGENGAGIGGGYEHGMGYGGDCPTTLIKGTSCVEAYGGFQAAGIGGGFLGGADEIEIDLSEDDSCIARGTFDDPSPSKYYVKAQGGSGAAGIGGGGDDYYSGELTKNNSTDCGSIRIGGGAVFAKGGGTVRAGMYDSDDNWCTTGDFNLGAGAGIGGSAGASHAEKIEIEHGYIWARGGSYSNESDRACDIGTGGDYSKATLSDKDLSKTLTIKDGTVLTEKMDRFESITINGGSVQAKLTGIRNKNGDALYQTTGRIDKDHPDYSEEPGAGKISVKDIRYTWFGKDHIYAGSETDYRFWLYLPEYSDPDRKELTVDLSFGGKDFHYYGYTDANNTGVVKIDGNVIGAEIDKTPTAGSEFDVRLLDEGFPEGARWHDIAVEGNADIVSTENAVSPGAVIRLHAGADGEFSLSGSCDAATEEKSDIYWGSRFTFSGSVKPQGGVYVSGDLSKVYDASPASRPTVTTNSDAVPYYHYYTEDGTQLSSSPVAAGNYYVQAFVEETENYGAASSVKCEFTIFKAPTAVTLDAAYNADGTAHISSEVIGLYYAEGTVRVTVEKEGEEGTGEVVFEQDAAVVKKNGDHFTAETDTDQIVQAGNYKVTVRFNESANYEASSEVSDTYIRHPGDRSIEGQREYTVNLTAGSFRLNLTAIPPGEHDEWSGEVVFDSYRALGLEETIELDENDPFNVQIKHAGRAVIKVTLSDGSGEAKPVTAYVSVTVNPRALFAKPFEKLGSSDLTYSDEAWEYTNYGCIEDDNYQVLYAYDSDETGLYYSDQHNTDFGWWSGERFGTLETVPLDPRTEVGNAPLTIRTVGTTVTLGGKEYENFFLWRDYDITYREGSVRVDLAAVAVKADDASAVYGEPEPGSYAWHYDPDLTSWLHGNGRAAWDSDKDILEEGASAALDPELRYAELDAGTYEGAVILTGTATKNYTLICTEDYPQRISKAGTEPGSLTIEPADISDTERFSMTVSQTELVYNGEIQNPEITITDTDCFGETRQLSEGVDYELSPGNAEDGTEPVRTNAGTVEILVTGKGNYQGTRTVTCDVRPCLISVKTESAKKIYDGTPLTAGGTITGIPEADQDLVTFTVTGSQTEAGFSRNTYSLTFAEEGLENNYRITGERLGLLYVGSNDLGDYSIVAPEDVVYNGAEQKQPVQIKDVLGNELEPGTDYVLTYVDDTAAGLSDEIVGAGTVTVTAEGRGRYTGMSSVSYEITPAPLTVKTDGAEKVYDGTPLTAPGCRVNGWVNEETASAAATGRQTDAGDSPNTYRITWDGTADRANYEVVEEDLGALTVTPADGQISFTESPEKVYDAAPAAEPAVQTNSTGAVTFRWYEITGTGDDRRETGLNSAPVTPGSYKITAEQAADGNHTACSAELEFGISKAPTAVTLEAAGGGIRQTLTAYVTGTYEADGADGNITFTMVRGGTETVVDQRQVQVTACADGRLKAEITYDTVPAGKYKVTVQYESESGNYEPAAHTENYDKDLARRGIEVEELREKTYGDDSFALAASAESGMFTPYDVWSYEVIYDSFGTGAAEPTVSVESDGTVTVNHAGRAVIEVTLTDGGAGVYEDAKARVTVIAARAPLMVTSYAFASGGAETGEAVYGTLGSLSYGLKYEGLVNGDTADSFTHGHGKLEAVPLISTLDASEDPYEIGIARQRGEATADNPSGTLFLSRDYELTLVNGSLRVVPADISDTERFAITAPQDVVYNGKDQKQQAELYDGSTEIERFLTADTDYREVWPEDTVNAGTVTAQLNGTGNYTGSRSFSYGIGRKALQVKTAGAEKVYDGTPLTAPGKMTGLIGQETAEFKTTGSRTDVGSAENTYTIRWNGSAKEENYEITGEDLGMLTVTTAAGSISFTESPEKVYDSRPAEEPDVQTNSTGTVVFRWFDEDGQELGQAPVKAGTYKVTAEQAADANHSACSAEMEFAVSKAPTAVFQEVSASGTGETVTVWVTGTYEADGADGTVEFTVIKDGSTAVIDHQKVNVSRQEDGRLKAEISYDPVPAGQYEVTAAYASESGNYEASTQTRTYDRSLLRREIVVQEQWEKDYGDDGFVLDPKTEPGKETDGDVWSCRVTYDSYSPIDAEPTVSVDEDGRVSVNHAGTAVIEVTLTDGGANLYEEAKANVTVTVKPAPLTVTSYAFTEAGETDTAVYGSIGELSFGLKFDGLKAGDTPEDFTHGYGTMEAVPVAADAVPSENPYEIGILRIGRDVQAGSQAAASVFFARDYEITEVCGTLTVTEPDILYAYAGAGEKVWTRGDTDPLTFVFKRSVFDEQTFGHYAGAEVDGKAITDNEGKARSGSLSLDLTPEYLGTLKPGKHTLKVMFDDGNDPEVQFTVKEKSPDSKPVPSNTPSGGGSSRPTGSGTKTGDDYPACLWMLLLIFGAAGAAAAFRLRRRTGRRD